jgi:catechol 2,3-dioxygenase-like lactoylglutathione lyase family enzyme
MRAFSMEETSMIANPLRAIRHLDYTVIFARDLTAMRRFYVDTMGFELDRQLGESWLEFRIGASVLALTKRGTLFDDPSPPAGALSLQLAFRVAPAEVDSCAEALRAAGVRIEREPTDQAWGHRTVFFRDPDGNVLEIYAEI